MGRLAPAILCLPLLVGGCVFADDKPPASKLEYLNGEKYQVDSPVSVGSVPIGGTFGRSNRQTVVRGKLRLVQANGLYSKGVRFEKILLKKAGATVATSSSDINGDFTISAELMDGRYRLVVDSEKYAGALEVEVRGYDVGDLILDVTPR